ncbi:MAG: DUF4870 domain-containing protein [Bacilli bacterium]|nr:DUF4870 domain-containing protein [Bacilli bacterium]
MATKVKKHKSSIGDLDANVMAIISYVGGSLIAFVPGLRYFSWAVPLVIYLIEKKSPFVKKHAIQSLTLQIVSSIIMFILYIIIGGIIRRSYSGNPWAYISGVYTGLATVTTIAMVISIIFGIFAIIAIIKAYNYEEYSIPLIGKLTKSSENVLNKVANNEPKK